MASKMESVSGEVNTWPATAALSIPAPTYPACAGSCPLPPPEMMATCWSRTSSASARQITRCPGKRFDPGLRIVKPSSISSTAFSGRLTNFFMRAPPGASGLRAFPSDAVPGTGGPACCTYHRREYSNRLQCKGFLTAKQRCLSLESHVHGGSVCEVDVGVAVAIVINQQHAAAHGFDNVTVVARRNVVELDSAFVRDVGELRNHAMGAFHGFGAGRRRRRLRMRFLAKCERRGQEMEDKDASQSFCDRA